jgi:probable addiction module antidote protein
MPKRTGDFNAWRQEKLSDPQNAANYLNAALEHTPELFLDAVKDVVQARKVSLVAKQAGVSRESIYRTFSATGNPTLDTFTAVLRALNVEISGFRARGTAAAEIPVPEVPRATGGRKSRGRHRRTHRNPSQQLAFSFGGIITTSVMQEQNASSFATHPTEQRNTGSTSTRVEVEPQAIALPGFIAHVQRGQSAGAIGY